MKIVLVLALAACAAPKPAAPPPTPAPAPVAKAATGVELGELKFFTGDDLGMQLHANGHLEVRVQDASWQDVGSLTPDGTIHAPDGSPHGRITPDGAFVAPSGKVAPFKLDGDVLVQGDKRLSIDAKGEVQGGNTMLAPMRVDGATTPGLKRTALVVLALLMSGSHH